MTWACSDQPSPLVGGVEAERTAHLGRQRMAQLRSILGDLREITDPYA